MRDLSANALAQIAVKQGNEPLVIIEVDWIEDNAPKLYADRDIGSIPGRIIEFGSLDNVIGVSESNSSQELAVTLDDTDGTIKEIINNNDIHKRSARVYQWFEGMDLDDRFLLFAGKISTPITWNERDRLVGFTIISQLEDKEIGFSAEEGEFEWIPKGLIGVTWPMAFGKVQDVPCMQFNDAVTGSTLCGVGIVSGKEFHNAVSLGGNDQAIGVQLNQMNAQMSHLSAVADAYDRANPGGSYQPYSVKEQQCIEQREAIRAQRDAIILNRFIQELCATEARSNTVEDPENEGCNPVRILGGEDFPQNIGLNININGGIFTGSFDGDLFTIVDRTHPLNEDKAENAYNSAVSKYCEAAPPYAEWDFQSEVPYGYGDIFTPTQIRNYGWSVGTIPEQIRPATDKVAQHFWADAGSTVSIADNEPITYVVSTIPGTVLAVKAYKTFANERKLVNVPTDLWYAETVNYGPVTAVQVVTTKPLSTITDQGWENDLYVTFESDVGPHTCDILEYLIDNYTDLTYDSASFTAIRTKLDPFPMNFPILDRKNALTVLQEIAFQARCALWLTNGVFYIKYLPEEPTSNATITLSELDAEKGVGVEFTSTEDLITKMIVTWRISWAPGEENKIILRHNVKKYGTQEGQFNFYAFNQPDIVLKAATFWLIRKSNTWKRASFKSYLTLLNIETFDTVTLDFGTDYVSNGAIKAVVEEATYNSDDQTIDFVCLVPIKSGEMTEYKFFWPSQISVDEEFPTAEERAAGFAGGDGIGSEATGELPIGFTDPEKWGDGIVWVGGPNVVFRGHADYGESTPSDIGFVAQKVIDPEVYAELTVTEDPDPDLTINYQEPIDLYDIPSLPLGELVIDLHNTVIMDTENDNAKATLSSFFSRVNGDDELVLDTDNAKFGDTAQPNGELFHFKFDSDGGKFGAGTAWLKP
jgi:hypothetical protein